MTRFPQLHPANDTAPPPAIPRLLRATVVLEDGSTQSVVGRTQEELQEAAARLGDRALVGPIAVGYGAA